MRNGLEWLLLPFHDILSFHGGVDESEKVNKMLQKLSQCPLETNLLLRIPQMEFA
jgi:hypothetical protein